jgi:hypothetical protein
MIAMKKTSWLVAFIIGVVCFNATLSTADEMMCLENTQLDGKPVKLLFDSRANFNGVFLHSVKRLELKSNTINSNGIQSEAAVGDLTYSTLELDGIQARINFMIVDSPDYAYVNYDGFIGWPSVDQNILRINASVNELDFLSKVPEEATNWIHLAMITNSGTLELEVPGDHAKTEFSIDTGSDLGVELPLSAWQLWKKLHPHSPMTLVTYYSPMNGFMVKEQAWADQVKIGSLVLKNVPVTMEPPLGPKLYGYKNEATLGLGALSRFNLIVDGGNSIAYLKTDTGRRLDYPHNRLGAVFVPATGHLHEGVAIVEEGSPAYEAGVRNGDILVAVDDIAATSWDYKWLSRFYLPAGTKLHLTLQRGGKKFKTTATLRQIIPPTDGKDH